MKAPAVSAAHSATRIDLRVFPLLRFHWDPTPRTRDHIEQLFAQLRNESKEVARI